MRETPTGGGQAAGWFIDSDRGDPQGWYGAITFGNMSRNVQADFGDSPNSPLYNQTFEAKTFAVEHDGQDGIVLSGVTWAFSVDEKGTVIQYQPRLRQAKPEDYMLLEQAIAAWNEQCCPVWDPLDKKRRINSRLETLTFLRS